MTTDVSQPPTSGHERASRRRPFASWVKKLANLKHGASSSERNGQGHTSKRESSVKASKKRNAKNNNPYPQSGRVNCVPAARHSDPSVFTSRTGRTSPYIEPSHASTRSSCEERAHPTGGATSISTDHEASHSIHAPSHMASSVAGTSRTANGGIESRKGGDSTFSSPAPSVRSLTTTLTTIQSMGPNGAMNPAAHHHHGHSSNQSTSQTIQFSQPFPSSAPASAIPPHLAPASQPTTYNTATANNLLTDNASILTLASSSKRRRRRSMDTDASVRALAPSSLWGGSRESLPLSVLSANVENNSASQPSALHQSTSRMAASNERASIYSATGVAPALQSDRNSYYAGKQNVAGDGASVRSGLLGHGRADSISGSVMGVNSPLASPMEVSEKENEDKKVDETTRDENSSSENKENKDDKQ